MTNFYKTLNTGKLIRELGWLSFSQIGVIAAGLIGVKVLTSFLGPRSYGEVNLYMTISVLINSVIYGPLTAGVQRFCSIAIAEDELSDFIKSVGKILLLSFGGLVALLLVFIFIIVLIDKEFLIVPIVLVVVFSIFMGSAGILNGIHNIMRNRAVFSIHQALTPWLRLLIVISLLSLSHYTHLISFFLGYLLADLIVLISNILTLKKFVYRSSEDEISDNSVQKFIFDIVKYSLPFVYWGIFNWGQVSADRWALSYFSSYQDVGFYAVLYQLGTYPVLIFTGVIIGFILPILFQAANSISQVGFRQVKQKFLFTIIGVTAFILFLTTFTALFHQQLFWLISPKEFRSVSYLLPILIVSSGLTSISQIVALIFNISLNTHKLIPIQILLPILGIALMFSSAKLFGLTGVVYGSLIYGFIYLGAIIIISHKEFLIFKRRCHSTTPLMLK